MPSLLFEPRIQIIDKNGEPVENGYIYTYEAGTSTPKDTYDDYALTTPNDNPIRLADDGRPKDNKNVFLDGAYKIDIRDADNVSIAGYPVDNVISASDFDFTGLTASVADLNSTTTTAIDITANYPITLTDRGKNVLANASSASIDVTLLPVATAGNGYKITIKKIDNSKNIVTVKTNASETIDVRSQYILYDYNDFIEVLCDGSNWKLVASQIRGTLASISIATNVTLNDNGKLFLCDASTAEFSVSLPSAAVVGRGYQVSFKKTDATANAVTVQTDGAETIDGNTSLGLLTQYEFYEIKSDGDDWFIVNETSEVGGSRTGDTRQTYRTPAEMPGWVRMDNGTISKSGAGGTARANDDTQNLFVLLWTNVSDTYCPVSSGRGASALDDFNAGKTLRFPITKDCALGSVGDTYTIGQNFGEGTHTLTIAEMPAHFHDVAAGPLGAPGSFVVGDTPTATEPTSTVGGGGPHNNMQPTQFMYWYIKL